MRRQGTAGRHDARHRRVMRRCVCYDEFAVGRAQLSAYESSVRRGDVCVAAFSVLKITREV